MVVCFRKIQQIKFILLENNTTSQTDNHEKLMETIILLFQNPVIIILLIIIFLSKLFPPKNINSLYGYRTVKSMKNKSNWDFAQKYSTNLLLKLLSLLFVIQIILYMVYGSTSFINISLLIGLIICVALVLYLTEKRLK